MVMVSSKKIQIWPTLAIGTMPELVAWEFCWCDFIIHYQIKWQTVHYLNMKVCHLSTSLDESIKNLELKIQRNTSI